MRVHQAAGLARAELPEVRERRVVPEETAVGELVQLRDAHAVPVGGGLLGHDVHRHLGEIEVRPDAHRRGDAGGGKHLPDHRARHDVRGAHALPPRLRLVAEEVARAVDEGLVHAVDVDILWSDVVEVDREDQGRDALILRHTRRRDVELRLGAVRGVVELDRLLRLEEPGAGGYADRLERGGDGEADRLVRARLVRHQQPRLQRVEPARHALHGGIVAFQIDTDTGPQIVHGFPAFLPSGYLSLLYYLKQRKARGVIS